MIARSARAWAPMSPGMPRAAVRSGVGRAGDPAGVADHHRPAVARGRLPRPARRDPAGGVTARSSRQRDDLRDPRRSASSSPASSVVRGHDRLDVEILGRRVVVAADRAEAVEARDAHPGRRVGVRRAAGRGIVDLEAEAPRDRLRRGRRAGRSARASPSATSGPSPRTRPSCPSTSVASATPARPPPPQPRARRASSPGRRPRACSARARRSAASRRRSTPTLTVTPGQRPLSACRSVTIRAASRIALRPFSGSTPACAARPVDVQPDVDDPLARRHDVAVGAGALEDERDVDVRGDRADVRRRGRRADLLVRVGDEHEPLERQARRARRSAP